MEPRPFFIEDFLERNRFHAQANLGESGLRNFSLSEILQLLDCSYEELGSVSLRDSPNQGSGTLRKKIASLYGDAVTEENVLVTTGTSEALFLIFLFFLKKDHSFALFLPAFQALYEIPLLLGGKMVGYDISEESLSMEKFFKRPADIYIINHPHNPTGKGLKKEDWEFLEDFVPSSSSIFLFDEHYRFLNWEGESLIRSGLSLGDNCFALGSITKCFGVTGLRIGWIVGRKDWIQRLRSFKDYTTHTVNPLSEFLCEKILEKKNILLNRIRKKVLENIQCFQEHVIHMRSIEDFQTPTGGLVSFPKLREGISSQDYSVRLMEEASVFVLPGSSFEKEGFVRVGFGEDPQRFREGILRWIEWDHQNFKAWL